MAVFSFPRQISERIGGKGLLTAISVILAGMALAGCGYHVAGHSDVLPKSIHVIAVPTMENKTSTFKIEQQLTAATIHEFLAKTNYRIVSDANGGDALLTGKVLSMEVVPLLFQSSPQSTAPGAPTTASATAMMVTMRCEVTLRERDNDKVLYHTDNFVFRNEYQLASAQTFSNGQPVFTKAQVESFFQEGQPALERMSTDFATRLVAAVTENF
ncbi:MAG TPA: LPS assembly lipoprotein LptE [Dongiaceae bacterium]|nr:LPS assembly lipoprotein LptE [Dongiaceae bacterium]